MRWRLTLLASALLAVGCAHHHHHSDADSAATDSSGRPHRRFSHRDPNLETEEETTKSYANPSPSPGGF
ncbi:MAG TPA: hypothetical protein VJ721_03645 [Chthoniobacterales bacterium]|nr:hypothetical protein [Chthoniobacterales bacterium]